MKTKDYQLVLQFPYDSIYDLNWLQDFETILRDHLADDSEVDGHDVGPGEMNIFIHTEYPNRTFEEVRNLLEPHLKHLKAAYRTIESDDWTILFPEELRSFNVI